MHEPSTTGPVMCHQERLGYERQACQEEQTKGLLHQTLVAIKPKMNKDPENENDDNDDKEDHKPTAQEKKQAKEVQATSDSDNDGPTKKRSKKESFTLGCEVLFQHIKFDDGEPSYIDTRKLQGEVQEASQIVAELDAIRKSINAPLIHMRIYTIGIEMNLVCTRCISMCKCGWVSYNKIKKRTNYCFQLGQC